MDPSVFNDFIDSCSCYIWAIDGWHNKVEADKVSALFVSVGTSLAGAGRRSGNREARLLQILEQCTLSKRMADKEISIFAEFENDTDATPAHMWFVYDGYMYDTMPGKRLRRRKINSPDDLYKPGCNEGFAWAKKQVSEVKAAMTERQWLVLQAASSQWQASAEADFEEYLPADNH